jgi:putative ABC transport system permease protein
MLRTTLPVVFIAVRNVLRQQRRSLISLIAIVAGVAALIFAGGFIAWILQELREQTIRTQLGHIQVRPQSSPDHAAMLGPAPEARLRIAKAPHVVSVTQRVDISGLVGHGDATLAFVGMGVEPGVDPSASGQDVIAGQRLDPAKRDAILVGEGLAAALDLQPGDRAVLIVNLPGGGVSGRDVTISGIFRTVSKAYDDVAVRVPFVLAQELQKRKGADLWVVTLDSTDATDPTLTVLRGDPALRDFRFVPWTRLADFYNKAVVLYARQFAVMQVLIAVIIVLSIMNTMMMSVSERTWEIGTMMALGTPRSRILRIFVSEGAVLGIAGGAAGVALGCLVNSIVSAIGIPMPAPPGMTHGFTAQASLGAGIASTAFLLAVVATVTASIAPAFTASRLVIVDALRASR